MKIFKLWVCTTLMLHSLSGFAEGEKLFQLQKEWAVAMYEESGKKKEDHLLQLTDFANEALNQAPKDPELLTWSGIVFASYAGQAGGLNALSWVKKAKANLETAIAINSTVLQGSAWTSLGSLYYQVPGWPLSFGDAKKAEQCLRKAIQINPKGIDPNYFMADFLSREKRWDEAMVYANQALEAPKRPGRELADEGRRQEIMVLTEKIRQNQKKSS